MTRHELHQILQTPSFDDRKKKGLPVFDWEHYCKSFQHIPNELAIKHYMELNDGNNPEDRIILKCNFNSDVYYFGVGLKDCDNISSKKLKELYRHGSWSVYTWCD